MKKDVEGAYRNITRLLVPAMLPLALAVATSHSLAQSDESRGLDVQSAMKAAGDERGSRPQLELAASTLPRFDANDSATRSRRLELSLLPAGRSSIGPTFGLTNAENNPSNALAPPVSPGSVDLGVHWRYMTDGNNRVDVRAWRRTPQADAAALLPAQDPSYGARVEMQVNAPTRGFIADKGFVGFQLEGNARLTFHRTHGVPMVYYRAGF